MSVWLSGVGHLHWKVVWGCPAVMTPFSGQSVLPSLPIYHQCAAHMPPFPICKKKKCIFSQVVLGQNFSSQDANFHSQDLLWFKENRLYVWKPTRPPVPPGTPGFLGGTCLWGYNTSSGIMMILSIPLHASRAVLSLVHYSQKIFRSFRLRCHFEQFKKKMAWVFLFNFKANTSRRVYFWLKFHFTSPQNA